MPMGIVSDDDFKAEIKEQQRPGRKEGDNNVPESLRKIISDTAITDGRSEAVKLAQMFGASESSVSAYTRGSTSTVDPKNKNHALREHNLKVRNKIQSKAQNKLVAALDAIDPDELGKVKAVELSQIAKNLAGVVRDFSPDMQEEDRAVRQQQLVIFAPYIRREDEFPVINALNE